MIRAGATPLGWGAALGAHALLLAWVWTTPLQQRAPTPAVAAIMQARWMSPADPPALPTGSPVVPAVTSPPDPSLHRRTGPRMATAVSPRVRPADPAEHGGPASSSPAPPAPQAMPSDRSGGVAAVGPAPAVAPATVSAVDTGSVPSSGQAVWPATPVTPSRPGAAPDAAARAPAGHAGCTDVPHPLALRERGIEGLVRLRVLVGPDGRARQVQLAGSSGWRLFDEAALAQARTCRFRPALEDGTPVPSWVEFPVRFALDPA